MILRWGLGAEELAWASIFLIAPVSGVYYPIAVLPAWLRPVAYAVPSSHVFEGMRAVLREGALHWDRLGIALALDALYVAIGASLFAWAVRYARVHGTLLAAGE
jgi:ABC-2 type transport system permease protein